MWKKGEEVKQKCKWKLMSSKSESDGQRYYDYDYNYCWAGFNTSWGVVKSLRAIKVHPFWDQRMRNNFRL